MAITLTTTSNFSNMVQAMIAARAEEELRSSLIHVWPDNYTPGRFIKGTNLIKFPRFADLALISSALGEGVAPTASNLTIDSESFSATQFGNTIGISDLAAEEYPQDIVAIAAERVARQAVSSLDVLVRDILAAGTSVLYVTGSARSSQAVTNIITGAIVKKVVANLEANNVPRFADGYYRCLIHPYVKYDLETDTAAGGWMDANKYTNSMPLLAGELGAYAGVRFMVSSQAKVFATAGASSANVYSSYFFGPDSYSVADLQRLQAYYVAPGGDHSDPLAQQALVGWKFTTGAALIVKAGPRYIRLESGATIG